MQFLLYWFTYREHSQYRSNCLAILANLTESESSQEARIYAHLGSHIVSIAKMGISLHLSCFTYREHRQDRCRLNNTVVTYSIHTMDFSSTINIFTFILGYNSTRCRYHEPNHHHNYLTIHSGTTNLPNQFRL